MALWSPAVVFIQILGTIARSLTSVRSAQKCRTRADADVDDDYNSEDVSNALNTSIVDPVDRGTLAKQTRFVYGASLRLARVLILGLGRARSGGVWSLV
jgi:hypothetical protein